MAASRARSSSGQSAASLVIALVNALVVCVASAFALDSRYAESPVDPSAEEAVAHLDRLWSQVERELPRQPDWVRQEQVTRETCIECRNFPFCEFVATNEERNIVEWRSTASPDPVAQVVDDLRHGMEEGGLTLDPSQEPGVLLRARQFAAPYEFTVRRSGPQLVITATTGCVGPPAAGDGQVP